MILIAQDRYSANVHLAKQIRSAEGDAIRQNRLTVTEDFDGPPIVLSICGL